jgi:hypothetical protein
MIRRAVVSLLLVCSSPLMAQQQSDPEWPCVQALVPELSQGIFWPEVIEEEVAGTWKKDKAVAPLARALGDLPAFTDKERERIADFAEAQPDADRKQRLNMLADGVLHVANGVRKQYIRGIKRYTRQQISIAGQIETTLNELTNVEGSVAVDDASRAEIEETLAWHQRVYDQREHAVKSLCDRPVELEEILSEVMREIAQHLP